MKASTTGQVSAMTALIGMTWLSIPVALAAPALTNAELSQLVRKQAQQIKRLNARIDRLEKEKKQPGKQAAAPGKNRP
jgi:outer membrane murein-binding lipoprotein Lpp